jgi:hypothetical protein
MASPFLSNVDRARITPVRLAYRPAKAVCGFRNGNQVDMGGHQAVRPYGHTALITPFGHTLGILLGVIIAKEGILPAVAALGYMMGIMRSTHSRDAYYD